MSMPEDLWWDGDREAFTSNDVDLVRDVGQLLLRWAQENGLTIPQALGYVEMAKAAFGAMLYRPGGDEEPQQETT